MKNNRVKNKKKPIAFKKNKYEYQEWATTLGNIGKLT